MLESLKLFRRGFLVQQPVRGLIIARPLLISLVSHDLGWSRTRNYLSLRLHFNLAQQVAIQRAFKRVLELLPLAFDYLKFHIGILRWLDHADFSRRRRFTPGHAASFSLSDQDVAPLLSVVVIG